MSALELRDQILGILGKNATKDLPRRLPSRVSFLVGKNLSKSARSPRLWGAAFAALGFDGAMFPLDVTADKLGALLSILDADRRVIGVAVAAPYKSDFAALLGDRLSAAAKRCGSINLMSRDSSGRLHGSNTDGIGAVESLREVLPDFSETQVLVLGCGGTGRAVIATLISEMKPANVTVAVRGIKHTEWLTGLGVAVCAADLRGVDLGRFGVVINCTTVGWGDQAASSPLSRDQISTLRADCTIFDVVYQPDPTLLLEQARQRGLRTLSGTRMNLLQAVIAFSTANDDADRVSVANAMKAAVG